MNLPCRHMFAVRGLAKLELFSLDLAAERWSMAYLTRAHNLKSTTTSASLNVNDVTPAVAPSGTAKLSSHQKYSRVFRIATSLASLGAEVGMQEFEERLATLQELHDQWTSGKNITSTASVESVMELRPETEANPVPGTFISLCLTTAC